MFPVAAALLLAVVARRAAPAGPRRTSGAPPVPPRAALLCLLPAVADLAENLGLVVAVFTGGPPGVVAAALLAKSVKLTAIAASGALVPTLLGLALGTAGLRDVDLRPPRPELTGAGLTNLPGRAPHDLGVDLVDEPVARSARPVSWLPPGLATDPATAAQP